MKPVLRRIADYAGSLSARIALILTIGISVSAIAALLIAERARQADFQHIQAERVLASAQDVIVRLERDPVATAQGLADGRIVGARMIASSADLPTTANAALSQQLVDRIGQRWRPRIAHAAPIVCERQDPFWHLPRMAGFTVPIMTDCWLLMLDAPGRRSIIGLDLPRLVRLPSGTTDPLYLSLVVIGAAILSLIVARLATAPLRRLSRAADAFAGSIDAEPFPEKGPSDVRAALATFNLMQERVREGLRERTRMLASISHDLQTPLTRLRLRLEDVEDEDLRERLIADLSATLAMVRRGLDLARSGESAEEWTVVDLDSLLATMADDAAEFGQQVSFVGGCGARVRVRPDLLTRCLTNLIENAVKYGGDAELACRGERNRLVVTIRDHGPGMDAALLARAFEPFVRGDRSRSSGDGTGIGLAISRTQAAALGGSLALDNHPDGGVIATLTLPRGG